MTAVPPHPFTLLALAAGLPALAWLLPAPWGALATLSVAAGLCLTPGVRPGFVILRTALFAAAPFWLFLFLLHEPPRAAATGLRITTMILSFVWVVAALPPGRLVEALVAARWPATAAYLFAATLTAVPALQARARRLIEAQRCRGLPTRGSLVVRLRALRALALPLVLSAIHDVDERAVALDTRGLTAGARRTPLDPPADSPLQGAVRWGLVALCAAVLWWRIA